MRLYGFFCCLCLLGLMLFASGAIAAKSINIPILCYHNLNPTKPGSMNMTPQRFESEIKWLKSNGFSIISLKEAMAYLQGTRPSLPSKPIVITDDDGWESVYLYMLPIVRKYNIPVTLFIFPQAISVGKNNLTWAQLIELQKTGLFDIQSHTYSHPNFKHAKRNLSADNYHKFVMKELIKSKKILEEKMGKNISLLAWPFGIYNDELEKAAEKAGYQMAFTIDYRTANRNFRKMSQPRYMILESASMKVFHGITNTATANP